MKKISSGRLCRSVAFGALFTATSGFAFAQQTQPTVDTVQPAEEQEADDGDVVVITGSRIQNDTFTSASAMTSGPSGDKFEVAGLPVRCAHCRGELFVEGRALLNTAGMSFLNLDWANRSAATLACVACGRIEWFLADPEERP
jgi:hypothetical protein